MSVYSMHMEMRVVLMKRSVSELLLMRAQARTCDDS